MIQSKSKNIHASVVSNYFLAFVIALSICLMAKNNLYSYLVLLIGSVAGFFYATGLHMMIQTMNQRGLVITISFSNMAVLIPCIFSVTIFKDEITWLQVIGLTFAILSIVFLSISKVTGKSIEEKPDWFRAFSLLFLNGGALSSHLFANFYLEENFYQSYIMTLFGSSLIISLVFWYFSKMPFTKSDILRGFLFGGANVATSIVTMMALTLISGFLFFPITASFGLLFTSILSYFLWKERLQSIGWAGIVCSLFAIALLKT